MPRDMKRKREREKRIRGELIAAGICIDCRREPAKPGCRRCQFCAEMRALAARNTYAERQLDRKCVSCGEALPPEYYYVQCSHCREVAKVHRMKREMSGGRK